MPSTPSSTQATPFTVAEQILATLDDSRLEHIHPRTVLMKTLAGLLPATFNAALLGKFTHGVAYIPKRLLAASALDNLLPPASKSSLFLADRDGLRWRNADVKLTPNSQRGRELWLAWSNGRDAMLLLAKPVATRKRIKVALKDLWHVTFTCDPFLVRDILGELVSCFHETPAIREELDLLRAGLESNEEGVHEGGVCIETLRSAMSLADVVDPWIQKQLTESRWAAVYNRVQGAIGVEWQLESMLRSLAASLEATIGYEFLDVLLVASSDTRFRAYSVFRRNRTGSGENDLRLSYDRDEINAFLLENCPHLVRTSESNLVQDREYLSELKLSEALLLPLQSSEDVLGLMVLYFQKVSGITQRDLERFKPLGAIIGRTIEAINTHYKLQRQATLDGLTELLNRRAFNDRLAREYKRAVRHGSELSLIILDIDHFKNYNDTNGHPAGDQLLRRLASMLKNSVRAEDSVARYGGEEFVVILPGNDVHAGLLVAEKIRETVAQTEFAHGEKQPGGRLTVSLGVAGLKPGVHEPRDLVERADQALYRAKEQGRNRSVPYQGNLDSL